VRRDRSVCLSRRVSIWREGFHESCALIGAARRSRQDCGADCGTGCDCIGGTRAGDTAP
jgi:hypothetical protein